MRIDEEVMFDWIETNHWWLVNEEGEGRWVWQVWGRQPQLNGNDIPVLCGEGLSVRAAIEIAMKGVIS